MNKKTINTDKADKNIKNKQNIATAAKTHTKKTLSTSNYKQKKNTCIDKQLVGAQRSM